MTARKHLKQLVRARMQKTGESYAAARRQVIRQAPQPPTDPALRWHFPGNVPAATSLRVLLAHAGGHAPHTGEPFSEAMVFGLAGGVGAGVFSFVYEAANFASFFVAGRHLWQDDLAYLREASESLGLAPAVRESAGAKTAERQLDEALTNGPCIAWVDMVHLPHRGLPAAYSGGGYHVVTIYRVDAEAGTALIGDLADEPIPIALADLAVARARIKKQKHRLLWLPAASGAVDLAGVVRDGLRRCHEGLLGGGKKKPMVNFTLEAFRVWGTRMHDSKDKESWERIFTPGPRLWNGLKSLYDYIEHYGTGGGLCRPLFADFLNEAAEALEKPALRSLAERYAELGRGWSELANAALPDDVPAFRAVKERRARKSELVLSGTAADAEERRSCDMIGGERGEPFPLSDQECAELRAGLQRRIMSLHEDESTAAAEMKQVFGSL